MKYNVSVTIGKHVDFVVEILKSRDHALKWIDGLKEFNHKTGTFGEVGSTYEMVFENKKGRRSVMKETLSKLDGHNITTIYEQGSVWNACETELIGHVNHTHYNMTSIFKFPWYLAWFIWMFKPFFIKQTRDAMVVFKEYVESLD